MAKIVCETMNNYLMFDQIVKCEMVAADKASRRMFKEKVNPTNPPLKKARMVAKKQVNQLRTEKQNNLRLKRQLKRLEALKKKLDEAGIQSKIDFASTKAKSNLSRATKSPVMTVDLEDEDIYMATPKNVKKASVNIE